MTRSIDKYLSLPTYNNDIFQGDDADGSMLPTPVATTLPASLLVRKVSDIDFGSIISPPSIPTTAQNLLTGVTAKSTGVPGLTVGQVLDIMLGNTGISLFVQVIDESYSENTGVIQQHDDAYVLQFSGKLPPRISISALVRETYTHPHKTILHVTYEYFLRASRSYATGLVALFRYSNWEYIGYMTSLRFGLSSETPTDYNTSFDLVVLKYGQPGDLIYGDQVTGSGKQGDNSSSLTETTSTLISGDL